MLKNKKAIYLLVPLNVLVWGFFIYRFYTAFHDADLPFSDSQVQVSKFKNLKDSVSYTLSLNYKDPFLRETEKTTRHFDTGNNNQDNGSSTNTVKKQAAPVKTQIISVPKPLPDVKYLGLIKNSTSGLATALISVNGQSHLIKPNETIEGILFKSFNNDSLVAKWGKERIVARK